MAQGVSIAYIAADDSPSTTDWLKGMTLAVEGAVSGEIFGVTVAALYSPQGSAIGVACAIGVAVGLPVAFYTSMSGTSLVKLD
jgi:hypothetical protein